MNSTQAQIVIESLRKGIPPNGYVKQFTVGRESEIAHLDEHLRPDQTGALLLKANYGAGKTHLLRYIKQTALEKGFVVSCVIVDTKSQVRFNRMDQVVGSVFRNIELPEQDGTKGIRNFLDAIDQRIRNAESAGENQSFWGLLTNKFKWDFSEELESTALFVVLRAWCCHVAKVQDLAEDYLYTPWGYRSQRKRLYLELVEELRKHFRDPRPEWKFYADDVFSFHTHGHTQSWASLRDLNRLAREAGYEGFILMFDEFEDVITNMRRINHQEAAFWNLFQFYSGHQFPGMSFFAVTPEFSDKCKRLLFEKDRFDFDFERFDQLQTFQMSPLETDQLWQLAICIMEAHATAYEWDPKAFVQLDEFRSKVTDSANLPVQDRARATIRTIVQFLDDICEES